MIHDLKTWPAEFGAILAGEKTHEVRRNDRSFAVGDTLRLREFEPCFTCEESGKVLTHDDAPECCSAPHGTYSGRTVDVIVTHITTGYGLPDGLCVMSVRRAEEQQPIPGTAFRVGDVIAADLGPDRLLRLVRWSARALRVEVEWPTGERHWWHASTLRAYRIASAEEAAAFGRA